MKRLCLIALALLCMLPLTQSAAYALNQRLSTLTVVMEYGGVTLGGSRVTVCRAADAREEHGSVSYGVVRAFAGACADFKNLTKEKNIALAAALDACASVNQIERTPATTDRAGKAVFTNLSAGLYLVAQADDDSSGYLIAPFLVAVPGRGENNSGWNCNVTAYPKTEPVKREDGLIAVSVYKLWAGTNNPPGSVSVQLYRNGAAYGGSVKLSAENCWSHTWSGLRAKDTWTADEINAPAGYVRSVAGSAGSGFVITNTKQQAPPPSPPGTPNTGDSNDMLRWIILVTAGFAGLAAAVHVLCASKSSRSLKGKQRSYR